MARKGRKVSSVVGAPMLSFMTFGVGWTRSGTSLDCLGACRPTVVKTRPCPGFFNDEGSFGNQRADEDAKAGLRLMDTLGGSVRLLMAGLRM